MFIEYRGSCLYAAGIALFLAQDASSWTFLTPYSLSRVNMNGNHHERRFMYGQQPHDRRMFPIASRIDVHETSPSPPASPPSSKGSSNDKPLTTRADWVRAGAYLAAIAPALALSTRDSGMAASNTGAVTVLGAGGKTGRECVKYLAERGAGKCRWLLYHVWLEVSGDMRRNYNVATDSVDLTPLESNLIFIY